MFQPNSYHEKRNTLNEMLIQQLTGFVMRTADPQTRTHLQGALEQYGRGQQLLRDQEATRVLGPVVREDGVEYVDAPTILEYLKANVGRTYFGTEEHTSAPDGSIGTAGFGKKFADWLASLPAFDASLSKDVQSGFYRDEHTTSKPLPLLLIRTGDEVTVVVFYKYVSVMTLNLAHVPADYRWESANHYPLRGEMFTYRGNIARSEFEAQFAAALSGQGIQALHTPVLSEVSAGLAETEEKVVVDGFDFNEQVTDTPAE